MRAIVVGDDPRLSALRGPAAVERLPSVLLDQALHAIEPLDDDQVLEDRSAVRACLHTARDRLHKLASQLASTADHAQSVDDVTARHDPHASHQPDPQVLRAIADVRTLRRESARERKARAAAEADVHRGVLETMRLLLSFLERRWPQRVSQCRAAARLAARLGESCDLAPDESRGLQVATLLQDVGLIALPDTLLRTSAVGLSPTDRALYQQHPLIAQESLGDGEFVEIGRWIRHHHERWDGNGYPDRLSGADIPLPSRLVALSIGYVEATHREGGTAFAWRRDQLAGGAYEPALLGLLDRLLRPRKDG